MKTQKVSLSGVVYVKDPRDQETIRKLKEQVQEYNKYKSKYKSIENAARILKSREEDINTLEKELIEAYEDLHSIGKQKVGHIINLSPGWDTKYMITRIVRRHKKKKK